MNDHSLLALRIYIIDDDDVSRQSIAQLLRTMHADIHDFASAESFLASYDGSPGVLLSNVRMPGMTGFDLQAQLDLHNIFMPIVFVAKYCCTNVVIKAIRNGATTVLEKPYTQEDLLFALHQAISDYRNGIESHNAVEKARKDLQSLTVSEHDVLGQLLAGDTHKDIAVALDISVRTVAFRRNKILEKMGVDNVVDLFRSVVLIEADDEFRRRRQHLSVNSWTLRR